MIFENDQPFFKGQKETPGIFESVYLTLFAEKIENEGSQTHVSLPVWVGQNKSQLVACN